MLADVYSESGDEERAEIIRVQVELARVGHNHPNLDWVAKHPEHRGLCPVCDPLFRSERELTTPANLERWRRPACGACHGVGYQHPLAETWDSQDDRYMGGQANWVHTAPLVRGLWCVEVPFESMGHVPLYGNEEHAPPWQFRDDWLAWAIACVREGVTFRVTGREPLGGGGAFVWYDMRGNPPYISGTDHHIPPLVWDALKGFYVKPTAPYVRYYTTAEAGHAALDRAVLALVCRVAWPDVKGET